MKKFVVAMFFSATISLFSGCSLTGDTSSGGTGGVLRSSDAGINWELKNTVTEKQTISKVDVLVMEIDPVDNNRIYLGTKDKGIVVSKNGADSWEKVTFPANKVYGLAVNKANPENIFAVGVKGKRSKVFRTDNYGQEWEEVYTEPSDGTVITSLAMDRDNSAILYTGSSEGVILKTIDGGKTWRNLYSAGGPVTGIKFGGGADRHIYFLVQGKEIISSDTEGNNFKAIGGILENKDATMGSIYSMAMGGNGALYIGTDSGMFRSFNGGENLEEVDVIASAKKFPIRSIAINPGNSDEIIYSAAQAIYKSVDSGKNWSTYQLNTGKLISVIQFNPSDVNTVYSGLRSF